MNLCLRVVLVDTRARGDGVRLSARRGGRAKQGAASRGLKIAALDRSSGCSASRWRAPVDARSNDYRKPLRLVRQTRVAHSGVRCRPLDVSERQLVSQASCESGRADQTRAHRRHQSPCYAIAGSSRAAGAVAPRAPAERRPLGDSAPTSPATRRAPRHRRDKQTQQRYLGTPPPALDVDIEQPPRSRCSAAPVNAVASVLIATRPPHKGGTATPQKRPAPSSNPAPAPRPRRPSVKMSRVRMYKARVPCEGPLRCPR